MLIDRNSKSWIIVAVAIFIIATVAYVPYHLSQVNGPSGGTLMGLIYGIAGTLMIFLAMALTPRKKLRTLRIGRVHHWMQAHVWFGLLSFPIILYHAGFRENLWGGALTTSLMLLFLVIEISGIVGLMMQQIIPTKMLQDIPFETIYEEIDHVLESLRQEATEKVTALTDRKTEREFNLDAVPAGAASVATMTPGSDVLSEFFQTQVLPFLAPRPGKISLRDAASSARAFDRLRTEVPVELQETANDLQSIVDERRQLIRQQRLHAFLHGWLLVHVPLSAAMLVLMVVHIVVALRYIW